MYMMGKSNNFFGYFHLSVFVLLSLSKIDKRELEF